MLQLLLRLHFVARSIWSMVGHKATKRRSEASSAPRASIHTRSSLIQTPVSIEHRHSHRHLHTLRGLTRGVLAKKHALNTRARLRTRFSFSIV